MKITYIIEKDLTFPLVEGLRKEVFLYATLLKRRKPNIEVEIVNINKKDNISINGINIINKNIFNIYFNKSDIIHYFGQPSPFLTLILLFSKYKKFYLNILDGEVGHFWKSIFSMTSIKKINKKVDKVYIQTKYQFKYIENYIINNKIRYLPPIIPEYKQVRNKSIKPRLLFMGHFSKYKGIYEQLEAYNKLKDKYKGLEFVIANSGLNNDKSEVLDRINEINKSGGNIIVKGKIDPEKELSESWIYLYTFKKVHDTFAVPISLYEANSCNTYFITGNIGGIPEYFNDNYLINNFTAKELFDKISYIIDNINHISTEQQLKVKIKNNNIINKIIIEYEK